MTFLFPSIKGNEENNIIYPLSHQFERITNVHTVDENKYTLFYRYFTFFSLQNIIYQIVSKKEKKTKEINIVAFQKYIITISLIPKNK